MTNYHDFSRFHNRMALEGTLKLETGLRIASGASDSVTGADIPIIRDALGQPFIPGSSFKGALRATVERLARTLNRPPELWACPDPLDHRAGACVTGKRKAGILADVTDNGRVDEQAFTLALAAETCTVCRLFGSPWLASKVRVRDLPLKRESWVGRVEVRTGVGIDRDTRTAAKNVLYSFEALPSGTEFTCEIIIENAAKIELGLLALGLREMEAGRVPLGGARSRGLGWSKLLDLRCVGWVDQDNLLDYLTTGMAGTPEKSLSDYIQDVRQAIAGGGA
jgi:CRISPR-associated RAMP protein (TIGR02581 family)